MTLFVSLLALVAAQTPPEPPPLSPEQTARLRALVKETHDKTQALKARLDDRESELARLYFEYEFDEKKASAIEAEIVELQREKLASYHKMQVEVRTIVGKERFEVLRQRLRLAGFFGPAPEKK